MLYKNHIRVLNIDLTNHRITVENREDLTKYLGGVGVASKLLEDNIQADKDVFHESQPIIFSIGAISTVFPAITKTVAMFYSPLTKELGESYAGGRMAMAIQSAGYDAFLITGKSNSPIYLSISNNSVEFKDASAIWGMNNDDTGRIIREREIGAGKRSIIRIGEAGENLVNYSSVCVDTYRHFGRLGLGAVMGSKNLKAISIIGEGNIPIIDMPKYFKAYQTIYKKATATDMMKKYHDLGTAGGVNSMNELGGIPVKNLSSTHMEDSEPISGEEFARKNLIRKTACTGCPVGCIHIGQFRKEFDDKGYEYENINVSYDYELIFSLGSYLGINSTDEILEVIEAVEKTGLDAISCGVCLGWATEAYSNSLVTLDDIIMPLEYGNKNNYIKAIEFISARKNKFYHILGQGSKIASETYGGQEYAMHFAGNETAGYHTGYGSVLGSAVGARHSHLCNGGYSVDQAGTFSPEEVVDKIFKEEVERNIINSLVGCLFARKVYDRDTILLALNSVGYEYTNEDLSNIALENYKTKLRIKKMLSFDLLAVKVPKRFFETTGMRQTLVDENTMKKMIALYNEKIEKLI